MRFPVRHNKGQSTDVGKPEKKDEKTLSTQQGSNFQPLEQKAISLQFCYDC